MDSGLIREQIKLYLKERGTKAVWISKQIDISESMLSHFRNGRVTLSTDKLQMLTDLLNG
jgi:hypothetical protein